MPKHYLTTPKDVGEVDPDGVTDPVFDSGNPRAIINLVPESLADKIKALDPLLLERDEEYWLDLNKKRSRSKNEPWLTLTDHRIRINFWHEYNKAQAQGYKMKISYIWTGVSSFHYFNQKIIGDPEKLAFMLCAPCDYWGALREAFQKGLRNLVKIVSADVVRDDNSLDSRGAKVLLDTVMFIDARLHGAITQKIEQKTLSVNAKADFTSGGNMADNAIDMKKRIEELQKKLKDSPLEITQISEPIQKEEVIDVTKDIEDGDATNE